MRKIIYTTIFLIFFFSASNILAISARVGSSNTNFISTIENKPDNKDVYIRYSVSNGLSMSGNTITIKQNGEAEIEFFSSRTSFVNKVKKIKLTKNEFVNLKSVVNNAKLFSLKDSYKCEKICPMDMSSTSITFNYYNKTKTISMYAPGNLPKGLLNVIKNLEAIQTKILNAK